MNRFSRQDSDCVFSEKAWRAMFHIHRSEGCLGQRFRCACVSRYLHTHSRPSVRKERRKDVHTAWGLLILPLENAFGH